MKMCYKKLFRSILLLSSLWPEIKWLNSSLEEKPHREMMDWMGRFELSGLVNSFQKCWNLYISLREWKSRLYWLNVSWSKSVFEIFNFEDKSSMVAEWRKEYLLMKKWCLNSTLILCSFFPKRCIKNKYSLSNRYIQYWADLNAILSCNLLKTNS